MATVLPMLDRYEAEKNSPALNLGKLGTWNTLRGSDPLPYSDNAYEIDEPAIKKMEGEFGRGRYGISGVLGGGSANSPGFTPDKKWSDSYNAR